MNPDHETGKTVETEEFDVIVVGGGPAGSTAATAVALRGHRVLPLPSPCALSACPGTVAVLGIEHRQGPRPRQKRSLQRA